jgi:hypothetical protein
MKLRFGLAPTATPDGSLDDLRAYGERLLSTFPAEGLTGVRIKEPAESVPETVSSSSSAPSGSGSRSEIVDPLHAFEKEREREREREREEGEVTGCREAVEILTRNPKKGVFLFLARLSLQRSRHPPYTYSSKLRDS